MFSSYVAEPRYAIVFSLVYTACCFNIYYTDMYHMARRYFLRWMTKKLESMGVTFEEHKVISLNGYLEKRVGFDVVVNCMGLGCMQAVCDEDMFPARGQVGDELLTLSTTHTSH